MKIEIAVSNALVERAVETIGDAAGTTRIGDGKIFMFDMENARRIRTGETHEATL